MKESDSDRNISVIFLLDLTATNLKSCSMPTYTYQCADCGHTYDAFQSMKVDPDVECPECKGRVDRLIGGGAGILFKGSGFYVTDYKNQKSSSSSSSASTGSSTSASTAAGTAAQTNSSTTSASTGSNASGSGGSTGS